MVHSGPAKLSRPQPQKGNRLSSFAEDVDSSLPKRLDVPRRDAEAFACAFLAAIPPEATAASPELAHLVQFSHPRKILAAGELPFAAALSDEVLASLFGVSAASYHEITRQLDAAARDIAREIRDSELGSGWSSPFAAGEIVLALGDSITDDYQSWAEILRHFLALHDESKEVRVVNAGISGDTSADIVKRLPGAARLRPDWVIVMIGTNDVQQLEDPRSSSLVSPAETQRHLATIQCFLAANTSARVIAITPPPIIESQVIGDPVLAESGLRCYNADIAVVADIVREHSETVVDAHRLFGAPPALDLFLDDGLHPSAAGQKLIASGVIRKLSSLDFS